MRTLLPPEHPRVTRSPALCALHLSEAVEIWWSDVGRRTICRTMGGGRERSTREVHHDLQMKRRGLRLDTARRKKVQGISEFRLDTRIVDTQVDARHKSDGMGTSVVFYPSPGLRLTSLWSALSVSFCGRRARKSATPMVAECSEPAPGRTESGIDLVVR